MTDSCNAEISLDQLAKIASFVVATDKQLTITWASEPVLKRAENTLGLKLSDIFKPIEPREEISPSSIARNMGVQCRILLKNGGCSTPLIGRWFPSGGGFILLAGPDVRKPEDLDKFSFDDFPENDLTIELLTTREEHIMSLKEAKSAANSLRDKNKAIIESAQRLESVNAELEKEITDRKRVEAEAVGAQDNLKTILARSPFGVAVIGRDRKIRWVNEYACALAGMEDADAMCGRECGRYLCPAQQKECPILDKGQTLDNSERILRRHDGREIPISKTVSEIEMNSEPVLLETFVDITERKQAEEALRDTMDRLKRMNRLMTGREERVIEMKKEVNALLSELGREPKYASVREAEKVGLQSDGARRKRM